MGKITALIRLYVQSNALSGAVPVELGRLKLLEVVYLFANKLTEGTTWLGYVSEAEGANQAWALKEVWMQDNWMRGTVPETLRRLRRLEKLYLGGNRLSGKIPDIFGDLTAFKEICFYPNRLTGSIPSSMGALMWLELLFLHENLLTGTIPDLSGLRRLRGLYLGGNRLVGRVPAWLSAQKTPLLNDLVLHRNRLTGPLPASLASISNLEVVALDHNSLTGTIPADFAVMDRLKMLRLDHNQLAGQLSVFNRQGGFMPSLQRVYLSRNRFTSTLPSGFPRVAPNLVELHASDNQLNGPIPESFRDFGLLRVLDASGNQLTSPIPDLTAMESVTTFLLAGNRFQGDPQLRNLPPKCQFVTLAGNAIARELLDDWLDSLPAPLATDVLQPNTDSIVSVQQPSTAPSFVSTTAAVTPACLAELGNADGAMPAESAWAIAIGVTGFAVLLAFVFSSCTQPAVASSPSGLLGLDIFAVHHSADGVPTLGYYSLGGAVLSIGAFIVCVVYAAALSYHTARSVVNCTELTLSTQDDYFAEEKITYNSRVTYVRDVVGAHLGLLSNTSHWQSDCLAFHQTYPQEPWMGDPVPSADGRVTVPLGIQFTPLSRTINHTLLCIERPSISRGFEWQLNISTDLDPEASNPMMLANGTVHSLSQPAMLQTVVQYGIVGIKDEPLAAPLELQRPFGAGER
jgi:Leucine-rich repeat (LRR) protein